MPVSISVSEVRRALYLGTHGVEGNGVPTTALLGKWFHEGLRHLIGDGRHGSPIACLGDVAADLDVWKSTLVRQAYASFVGPRVTRDLVVLHEAAPQVMDFWRAMQAACDWLCELCWNLRGDRTLSPPLRGRPWQALAEAFSMETPLSCTLTDPGWSDSVRLVGVADAILRLTGTDAWCVIEFKLGQTAPVADLGQACLYQLMIAVAQPDEAPSKNSATDAGGTLALVSFRPQRHEQLFSADELSTARQRLIQLIGTIAGVDQSQSSPPTVIAESLGRPLEPVRSVAQRLSEVQPSEEHLELGRGLVRTWAEYGVNVSLDQPVIVGPTFVRFPVTLGRGTTVNSVARYVAELRAKLRLKESPLIGCDEGQLVVEVQRPDPQIVWFDEIREQLQPPTNGSGGSRLPIGVDVFRRLVCADLNKSEHAHILAAGTTGSGKSEWLRLAIAGLMVTNTPDTLRLMVIDPKRNAFHALRDSPYLWRPLVFPDEQSAAEVLFELAEEMDRRYRLADGADHFSQFAAKADGPLPRIVCVCDEYRDLISRDRQERKQIEQQVCRLGAKARAAGIHLILATQEPSRDTIKGPLDSNMPARVGLKMGKPLESRMLLNDAGAENLLGHGDLLFKDVGSPRRLQAPLLSEQNRAEIFGSAAG